MISPRCAPFPYFVRTFARLLLLLLVLCVSGISAVGQTAPVFSQIVVFGDSFSDTGNVRARTFLKSGGTIDYPSRAFNYSDGRFTNSSDTTPSSTTYLGMWHEQLARTFLNLPAATYSLGGGTNYAFGGATTKNGTTEVTVVSTPSGDATITIDHLGKQMDDYLATHAIDPNTLYIVWGGINDLLQDDRATSVSAAAARATALFSRLAHAGAKYIMVPNVPPLGVAPTFSGDPARMKSLSAAIANYRLALSADLTASLSNLASQGITPTLYPVDVWTKTIGIYGDRGKYGFSDTSNRSQGNSDADPDHFLFWDDLHPTTAGHYSIAKSAHDALTIPFFPPGKAVNIATRVFVDTGERVSIAGFIVTGDISKKVLIRGIGPSLAASGVPTPLANPTLTLFNDSATGLMSNDDWKDSPDATEIMDTGIAPQHEQESAIIISLPPGQYTAALTGKDGTTGNGLVEVYDLASGTSATLGNVSTRGFVGTGDNAMIGGIIIGSGENPLVVIRALGQTLTAAGITEPLLDPTLELFDQNGTSLAFNDDWKDGQPQPVIATELAPADDHESAIVAFPAPGNYTAVVRGKAGTTGVALVEAYRLP